jgi:hypothetical protein
LREGNWERQTTGVDLTASEGQREALNLSNFANSTLLTLTLRHVNNNQNHAPRFISIYLIRVAGRRQLSSLSNKKHVV